MTAAVVDKEEVADQQGDAGFEDGFNLARGITPEPDLTPPVEPVDPTEEPQATPEAAAPEQVPDAAPEGTPAAAAPTEEESVTLSPAEVKSLLARLDDVDRLKSAQDKAFGTIGSMKTVLDKLQTSQATGVALELTDEDMAELDDFPEFKDRFKKTLQKVLSKTRSVGVAPPPDTAPLEEKFQQQLEQKLAAQSRQYEAKLLSIKHDDWKDVVVSDSFKVWLGTQPEDYRKQINDSWDAQEIGGALTKFKAHAASVKESKQTKTRRLEAAVSPTGVPAPDTTALNDAAAFEAGFKSARR